MNIKLYSSKILTEFSYTLITSGAWQVVSRLYRPIILNSEKVPKSKVVLAPNHRKTLDPFFIATVVSQPVHWAALKRFFTGEDSIFNNSKNPILCKITQLTFKGMGLVPIDRGGDNTESIKMLNEYLKMQSSIGIFPEGTTNKNPDEKPILEPKSGAFHFAKDNEAYLQPISIVWVPEELKKQIKNSVIINFRPAFETKGMELEDIKNKWKEEIIKGIEENNKIIEGLKMISSVESLEDQEETIQIRKR